LIFTLLFITEIKRWGGDFKHGGRGGRFGGRNGRGGCGCGRGRDGCLGSAGWGKVEDGGGFAKSSF